MRFAPTFDEEQQLVVNEDVTEIETRTVTSCVSVVLIVVIGTGICRGGGTELKVRERGSDAGDMELAPNSAAHWLSDMPCFLVSRANRFVLWPLHVIFWEWEYVCSSEYWLLAARRHANTESNVATISNIVIHNNGSGSLVCINAACVAVFERNRMAGEVEGAS